MGTRVNYRDNARKYFNSVTGRQYRAWADSAAAYYSSLAAIKKGNYVDAMNAYFDGLLRGTVTPPVQLLPTQAIVANSGNVTVANSANNKTVTGTAVVAASTLTRVSLPATAAIITSTQALTGVTPSGTYTNTVTFTVAGGVITAIALS